MAGRAVHGQRGRAPRARQRAYEGPPSQRCCRGYRQEAAQRANEIDRYEGLVRKYTEGGEYHKCLIKPFAASRNAPALNKHHLELAEQNRYRDGTMATPATRQWHLDRANHYANYDPDNYDGHKQHLRMRDNDEVKLNTYRANIDQTALRLEQLHLQAGERHGEYGGSCSDYETAHRLKQRARNLDHTGLTTLQPGLPFSDREMWDARLDHLAKLTHKGRNAATKDANPFKNLSTMSAEDYQDAHAAMSLRSQ